eukprot:NODE_59_length_2827_cov_52.406407_g55_i0.p3 GENE.NODE_59_length_2827_cov_52.406407_g55_i0~~NODE_59_length_2827_cov_52.406407_g55_i0.p3  ORF type:complete len:84 (+),score=15.08 NODE_59_length_2827_cov_52.406407_g55_i0:2479-2730(+)
MLANKQDLPWAMKPSEVLSYHGLRRSKQVQVFGTCATSGEGLHEAINWIGVALAERVWERGGYQPEQGGMMGSLKRLLRPFGL